MVYPTDRTHARQNDNLPAAHTGLALTMQQQGRLLVAALENGQSIQPAQHQMSEFLDRQVLPHLADEEHLLREAEQSVETRLLAHAMQAEQRAILARTRELTDAHIAWEAIAAVRAIHSLLAVYWMKLDTLLLPALASPMRTRS